MPSRHSYRSIRTRLTYGNITATLALFLALGGSAIAAKTAFDGDKIQKRSIPGNRVEKNSLGGTEIKESKLKKVPNAATADSAASATNAQNAANAQSAANAQNATSATNAQSAANAQNADALGGFSATQLQTTATTSSEGSCINPTAATSCASRQVTLPIASDVWVLATGAWYGTDSGDNSEAGECFITKDPATNSPESVRQEMGQTDDSHDDFERGTGFAIHATVKNVPAGTSTFRLRCDENNADFHVEHGVVSVLRVNP